MKTENMIPKKQKGISLEMFLWQLISLILHALNTHLNLLNTLLVGTEFTTLQWN